MKQPTTSQAKPQRKRMRSIRLRVTSQTIILILICVLAIGGVSVLSFMAQDASSSEQYMTLVCETTCQKLEETLSGVEGSVTMMAQYASESLSSVELARGGVVGATGSGLLLEGRDWNSPQQQALDSYLQKTLDATSETFRSIAMHSGDVLSYYFRLNPELSSNVQGFLISRVGGEGYVARTPTRILDYEVGDIENVGWYYLPMERGRPSWIGPYEDLNQRTTMISRIAPLYKAGTFIGIVGLDISYDVLVDQLSNVRVLDSGYVFLTDENGRIVYHPTLPTGTLLTDVNSELEATQQSSSSTSMISYRFEDEAKKAAWGTLSNGMRLIVCAPTNEINEGWHQLTRVIVLSASAILVVSVMVALSQMRRITEPLEELTRAAQSLEDGDFDVQLTYSENDEVGILTSSFMHLRNHLKVFINDLNSRAYADALTGVKNKGAFGVFEHDLNTALVDGSVESGGFALMMLDLNNLKSINDLHGHEKGDEYLKAACRVVCKVFDHSPVFRVGGDEFVVALQNEDLQHSEERQSELERLIAEHNEQVSNPWDKVNLAAGLATYDPQVDSTVEDVLRRADELMYQDKQACKVGRG